MRSNYIEQFMNKGINFMLKKKILNILTILVLASTSIILCSCEKNNSDITNNTITQATTAQIKTTSPQTEELVIAEINQEHLLVGPNLETIELKGQEILDGEEANMTVQISDDIEFDFSISLGHPNGTNFYVNNNSFVFNLAHDCAYGNVFDEFGFPKSLYRYQIACYDINKDGVKDVIIVCGNGKDELEIVYFDLVYSYFMDDLYYYPSNHLSGKTTAYIDENGKICIE